MHMGTRVNNCQDQCYLRHLYPPLYFSAAQLNLLLIHVPRFLVVHLNSFLKPLHGRLGSVWEPTYIITCAEVSELIPTDILKFKEA